MIWIKQKNYDFDQKFYLFYLLLLFNNLIHLYFQNEYF